MNLPALLLLVGLPLAVSAQTRFIDDRALIDTMHDRMEEMVEKERFPDMEAWMRELPSLTNAATGLALAELSLRELDRRRFYEEMVPRVYAVSAFYKCERCPKWHISVAAGFPITRDGVFVTNHHVVECDAERTAGFAVMDHEGGVWPVTKVLAADPYTDVAVIQVDGGDHVFEPLAVAPDPDIGDEVRCISHPNRRMFSYTHGIVSRFFLKREDGHEKPRMAITAEYAKGSSGAPIFDVRGNVVGMVSETDAITYTNDDHEEITQMVVKAAIPASAIRALIRDLPPM